MKLTFENINEWCNKIGLNIENVFTRLEYLEKRINALEAAAPDVICTLAVRKGLPFPAEGMRIIAIVNIGVEPMWCEGYVESAHIKDGTYAWPIQDIIAYAELPDPYILDKLRITAHED